MPDWAIQAIATGVSMAATLALTGWLFRQSDRVPETVHNGAFVMRYPPMYTWLGWIALGLFGACLVATLIDFQAWWVTALFVGFTLMGVGLLLSARQTHAIVDPDGLTLLTWTRREPLTLHWAEVNRVAFSRLGYLVIHTRKGQKVRLSAALVGAAQVADMMSGGLHVPGAREAADQLRQYRAAYGS